MSGSNENRRSFRQKSQSPEMTRHSKENHKEDRLSRSFLREARQSNSSPLVSPVRLSSRSTSSKRSENDSRRSKELSPRPEKQREHRSSASLSSKRSKKSFDTTDDSESDSDASEIFAKRSSTRSSTSRILDDKQLDLIDVRRFEKMKIEEKADLKRKNIRNLCRIVFEASSSSASISYLVSMIREINEHHEKQLVDSMPTILGEQPIISYESAFNNIIRDRSDGIFCIALHAALISSQDKKGLRRLGEDLNIDRNEFDVASILKSSDAFQQLLTILEERKINERKRFLRISPRQLPYKRETTVRLNPSLCSLPFDVGEFIERILSFSSWIFASFSVKIGVDLSGFQVEPNSNFTSDLIWSDGVPSGRVVAGLKVFQKLNRFIGTKEFIDRKFFLKVYRKSKKNLSFFFARRNSFRSVQNVEFAARILRLLASKLGRRWWLHSLVSRAQFDQKERQEEVSPQVFRFSIGTKVREVLFFVERQVPSCHLNFDRTEESKPSERPKPLNRRPVSSFKSSFRILVLSTASNSVKKRNSRPIHSPNFAFVLRRSSDLRFDQFLWSAALLCFQRWDRLLESSEIFLRRRKSHCEQVFAFTRNETSRIVSSSWTVEFIWSVNRRPRSSSLI